MNESAYCIQVFSKAPIEGFCKTRLANDIGVKDAALFQSRMIENTLSKICQDQSGSDVQLWCKPDKQHSFFEQMELSYPINTFNQQGILLGDIMDNASKLALSKGYNACIQIGTDSPELDHFYIKQALNALEENDIVIGPANDGGYVLLAQKKHHPELFIDINWGTSSVLRKLVKNIESAELSYKLIDTLIDIDSIDDLQAYRNSVTYEHV